VGRGGRVGGQSTVVSVSQIIWINDPWSGGLIRIASQRRRSCS
jgi:hypothetical protein